MQNQVYVDLKSEGFNSDQITYERYVNLRYSGSDTTIMIMQPEDGDYAAAFVKEHQREFSFTLPNRKVLVENLRVRAKANSNLQNSKKKSISSEMANLPVSSVEVNRGKSLRVYFEGGWTNSPLFLLKDRRPGDIISGPSMIYDQTQMIVVQPGATAKILQSHIVIDLQPDNSAAASVSGQKTDEMPLSEDPIQLSIMSNRFMGIAEQMGLTLQKTSVSVNIKERLDFSCALFGVSCNHIAAGPLMLIFGSRMVDWWQMHLTYPFILEVWNMPSVFNTNCMQMNYDQATCSFPTRASFVTPFSSILLTFHSPLAGGTHLPDITVITPIFDKEGKNISFYTASRGHHSEIGGILPGSMAASSTRLYEEGAQITSTFLVRDGVFREEEISKILVDDAGAHPGCSGTRKLGDNLNDLKAQIAANTKGANLVQSLIEESGTKMVIGSHGAVPPNYRKLIL